MTKKPLPSALPVEGDIFLALPLWWSSMPDSRGYRLCALRHPRVERMKNDEVDKDKEFEEQSNSKSN